MKNKEWFSLKLGKRKLITIFRSNPGELKLDFIHGGLCTLYGYGITSLIIHFSKFYNIYFLFSFSLIFTIVLLNKTHEDFIKLFSHKK